MNVPVLWSRGISWTVMPTEVPPVARLTSLLCYLSVFLGVPLLLPAGVWLLAPAQSSFIKHHARVALLIQAITLALMGLALGVIHLIFKGNLIKESSGNLGLGRLPELMLALVIGLVPILVLYGIASIAGCIWSLTGKEAGWPLRKSN